MISLSLYLASAISRSMWRCKRKNACYAIFLTKIKLSPTAGSVFQIPKSWFAWNQLEKFLKKPSCDCFYLISTTRVSTHNFFFTLSSSLSQHHHYISLLLLNRLKDATIELNFLLNSASSRAALIRIHARWFFSSRIWRVWHSVNLYRIHPYFHIAAQFHTRLTIAKYSITLEVMWGWLEYISLGNS